MPSENFWREIFLSENVMTKIFRANYMCMEFKLTQTKIKQVTVFTVHVHCIRAIFPQIETSLE